MVFLKVNYFYTQKDVCFLIITEYFFKKWDLSVTNFQANFNFNKNKLKITSEYI